MLWLFQTAVCSYSRTQLRKDVWTSDNFDRLSQQQMNFLLINLTNPLLLHYLSPLGLRMPAKLLRQKHCLNPEYVAYRFLLVELTVYHKPSSSWLSGIRPIIFLPRDFFSTLFSLATVCDISFFYCFFSESATWRQWSFLALGWGLAVTLIWWQLLCKCTRNASKIIHQKTFWCT